LRWYALCRIASPYCRGGILLRLALLVLLNMRGLLCLRSLLVLGIGL
jgi:hypothetical protein